MKKPICTIIAGPNGAGKTTFALNYLPQVAKCLNFINADMIAAGLAPLSPEREWMAASRLFLTEIKQFVDRREDFAFETTLSGRTYLRLIRNLQAQGWLIKLYYLWLPDAEMSFARVAERVAHGGHNIPSEAIYRRYPRSINNLLNQYVPLCDTTICFDNSRETPELIFVQDETGCIIEDQDLYDRLLTGAKQ